jgi:hypothetical protein
VLSFRAFLRRGGGDTSNYVDSASIDTVWSFVEPFWHFWWPFVRGLFSIENSLSLSLVLAQLLPFVFLFLLKNRLSQTISLMMMMLLFFPVAEAQLRLSSSIGFAYLGLLYLPGRYQFNSTLFHLPISKFIRFSLCFLFLLLSFLSHSSAIVMVPLLWFASDVRVHKVFKKIFELKISWSTLLFFLSFVLIILLAFYVIASRYSIFRILFSTEILSPLSFVYLVIFFVLSRSFSPSFASPPGFFYSSLFIAFLFISPFGWLKRFFFWLIPDFALRSGLSVSGQLLTDSNFASKRSILLIGLAFLLRQLLTYFVVDMSYLRVREFF